MHQPTLLLTGGTGFLGSHLLSAFLEQGYAVVLLKRKKSDLRRIESLLPRITASYDVEENGIERAFDEQPIAIVAHCATDYGRKGSDSLTLIQANLLLPLTILNIGMKKGLRIFLNTDTLLDKRINDYSLSKRHFREWMENASRDLLTVNVALEHFYGPNDDPTKFVSWVIDRMLQNEKHIALTDGQQRRDFIYIDDVVDAMTLILSHSQTLKNGNYHFEIGSGENTRIRDLVESISQECGSKTTLGFGELPYRINEVMTSEVDLSPLKKMGWRPKYSLQDGLKQTILIEKNLRKMSARG